MRPVRLIAEGFTAFRDSIEVDFTGTEFFALVGPTGSGKSSVLDAICFALYGSVPRYTDDRLVAPAITQGANEARVSLTFQIGGDEYVATRIVRRTASGGATTKEARLERGDEVIAGNAKELTEEVTRIIGLPFHHFTRCVALPQGDFAQFLHDKPSDRQDLVVKLLDLGIYERMQHRARARAAVAKNAITLAVQRVTELRDCTAPAEGAARVELDAIKALRTELKDAAPRVEQLTLEAQEARGEADLAARRVTALTKVKIPNLVRTLGNNRARAQTEHQAAERERARLEREATKTAKAVEGLQDPGTLQAALEAYDELSELKEATSVLGATLAETEQALTAARDKHADAQHAVTHAEAQQETALRANASASLAGSLVVGQPCPVCLQVVEQLPKLPAGTESRAKKVLEQAKKAEASARKGLDAASKRHTELASERQSAVKRATALERRICTSGTRKQLESRLADVERKRSAHDTAQQALHTGSTRERKAREKVSEIDNKLAAARADFQTQRDPLVNSGLDVPTTSPDLLADWESLTNWSNTQLPIERKRNENATARAIERTTTAEQALTRLVEAATTARIELPQRQAPSITALREAAAETERDAKYELDRITKGRKESRKLEKEIATTREQVEVADELARLLKANNFEQWLVNEALERLVAGASDTLEALSDHQYALAVNDKNEFEVIDHRNADERRPARTLSGGETFQASLALALALANQLSDLAAHGAAKLDAIFLDEGFGSLDPDSLDTVAATLETLGSDGRTVGIITHVRELAERVPTRYEVAKGPRTSTVSRVDA